MITLQEHLIAVCKGIWDHSTGKPAGSGSVKRWIKNKCIEVNGFCDIEECELFNFPLFSLRVFPKNGEKRITLL